MYIDLKGLENFSYTANSLSAYAFVAVEDQEQKLFIEGDVSFEKLMFTMAYKKYGSYCFYCGNQLNKKTRTIDHKIPVSFGGISILPNLVPSCKDCNEEKSNLTDKEYKFWTNLNDDEAKRRYRLKCLGKHEKEKIMRGTCLPQDWFECEPYNNIFPVTKSIDGKRYRIAEEILLKFGTFDRPIVLSDNGILLDGFITMILAKNEGINNPPMLKLENVIAHK